LFSHALHLTRTITVPILSDVGKLYKKYTTVALLTAGKHRVKLTVVRLLPNHTLKKKVSQTFLIHNRKKLNIKLKRRAKRIMVTVGTGPQTAVRRGIY
jgi:hypothetical protein